MFCISAGSIVFSIIISSGFLFVETKRKVIKLVHCLWKHSRYYKKVNGKQRAVKHKNFNFHCLVFLLLLRLCLLPCLRGLSWFCLGFIMLIRVNMRSAELYFQLKV